MATVGIFIVHTLSKHTKWSIILSGSITKGVDTTCHGKDFGYMASHGGHMVPYSEDHREELSGDRRLPEFRIGCAEYES